MAHPESHKLFRYIERADQAPALARKWDRITNVAGGTGVGAFLLTIVINNSDMYRQYEPVAWTIGIAGFAGTIGALLMKGKYESDVYKTQEKIYEIQEANTLEISLSDEFDAKPFEDFDWLSRNYRSFNEDLE